MDSISDFSIFSETWIRLDRLYGAIFMCFSMASLLDFKTSRLLLQLFRRILQRRSAVKLQKCRVDEEMSLDFPSERGWEDNDCLFWVALSFKASGRMLWYIVVKHNKGMPFLLWKVEFQISQMAALSTPLIFTGVLAWNYIEKYSVSCTLGYWKAALHTAEKH